MEATTGYTSLTSISNSTSNLLNETLWSPTTVTPKVAATYHCDSVVTFATYSIVAGVLCCLGFVGNSVSFLVLRMDADSRVAGFLLQILAFTDNLFLAAWFLHFTLNEAFGYFRTIRHFHVTWLYVRVYTYPLLFVTQTATIWLTVLIAASRYIAVCRPYSASRYCSLPVVQKLVAGIAVFSIAYNLPRFFEVKIIRRSRSGKYTLAMTQFGDSTFYRLVYFDILYIVITFVLPLLLLLFLNTRLTFAYRAIQQRRRLMRMRHDQHDHSITLVMIMVVLLFIMCNAPARIVQMIWRYETHRCPSVAFFMMTLSNVLEVLNSSSNFIIYCVFRKQFRKNLKKRLCRNRAEMDSNMETTQQTCTVQLNGTPPGDSHNSLMNAEDKSL